MSSIRSKGNKSTEWRLRALLVRYGLRGWKVRVTELEGKPDFVFEKLRVAIFVDGAFWHGAPGFTRFPKSRKRYWKAKIARNKERDKEVTRRLRARGWAVLRFWDYELRENPKAVMGRIRKKLAARRKRRRSR